MTFSLAYWPQWIYISLTLIGIGISMVEHGKYNVDDMGNPTKKNFGWTLFSTLLIMFLLWQGGFFSG